MIRPSYKVIFDEWYQILDESFLFLFDEWISPAPSPRGLGKTWLHDATGTWLFINLIGPADFTPSCRGVGFFYAPCHLAARQTAENTCKSHGSASLGWVASCSLGPPVGVSERAI